MSKSSDFGCLSGMIGGASLVIAYFIVLFNEGVGSFFLVSELFRFL